MAMVCPQCCRAYEQRWQCPQCQVILQYHVDAGKAKKDSLPNNSWPGTPWGRLVLGLLLSQGLYHAAKHLTTAGLLVVQSHEADELWTSWTGMYALQAFEAVSVLLAALLLGAGQRRAPFFGAFIGVWSGLLFIAARSVFQTHPLPISPIAESCLNLSVGIIGGLLGCVIWRPVGPVQHAPQPEATTSTKITRRVQLSYAGPVAWIRVVIGIVLAVSGVVWANVFRELIVEFSEGRLNINTPLQAELLTWEISAFAMLAGSALAGATKQNGLKQGLCVGVGTATVLLGVRMASPQITLPLVLITMLSALCLSIAGGWFGSQLLPPMGGTVRRKHASLGSATF